MSVELFSVNTCSDLTEPLYGNVSYTSGSTDNRPIYSVATYMCISGYALSSIGNRMCEDNGSWNGIAPTCLCELYEAVFP